MGTAQGKAWRGLAFPDLCLCDYINSCNMDFPMENGRNAVLAGNRVLGHNKLLTFSLYAIQDHMMKLNDALTKTGPTLHPGDSPACLFYLNTNTHGVIPHFRGPTPSPPIRPGLRYNENDVSEIPPKFWKDVKEGRIFLVERSAFYEDELFIACPTTTAEKKLPDRTIPLDRRIIWDGRWGNLFIPKCDYRRPDYSKIEDIVRGIITLFFDHTRGLIS